jgi:hypothetical protein
VLSQDLLFNVNASRRRSRAGRLVAVKLARAGAQVMGE